MQLVACMSTLTARPVLPAWVSQPGAAQPDVRRASGKCRHCCKEETISSFNLTASESALRSEGVGQSSNHNIR
jgi:hypothetical protein